MRALTRMLLLLSLLFLPSFVKADPLVVTDGSMTLTGITGKPSFSISGQNFSFSGTGDAGNGLPCPLCTAQDSFATFSLSKALGGDQIHMGSGTFNGVHYPRLFFEGSFEFSAGTVKLPDIVAPEIVLSTPFTFSGKLCGRTEHSAQADGCRPEHPDFAFSTTLTGRGVATIRFVLDTFSQNGTPIYRAVSLTYQFSTTPPQTITFTDDFNDNSRDPSKWTIGTVHEQNVIFSPPRVTPQMAVEEKNQRLEITPHANFDNRFYSGYVSAALWNLTGGSAMVEVLQTTTSGADTVFAIAIDSHNWYRFIVEDGFLYFQRKKDNVRVFEGNVRFDPAQHRFWRFRHDYVLDQMILEAGPDGANWVVMRAMPRNIPLTAMRVELSAGTFTSVTNPGKAIFDNFKLEAINNAAPTSTVVGLSATQYLAPESSGEAIVMVTRIGDETTAFTVDYSTSDTNSTILTPCQSRLSSFWASERCDYITTSGTLRFRAGETFKFIRIPIVDDGYVEDDERFLITLRNPQGVTLNYTNSAAIIIPNQDTQPATQNPIDRTDFFIRQQYMDFLGRTPEPEGFQFWLNRMTNCPAGSTACDRIDTSLRFFQSDEFQSTGFFVYRLYDAVLGRRPTYKEFIADVGRLTGIPNPVDQAFIKDQYLLEFINRSEFRSIYGQYLTSAGLQATDPVGFVNALTARVPLPESVKQSFIVNLQLGRTPARTVENFINTAEVQGVGSPVYERGFITMQYFGYLRRDPDEAGFNFWVGQLMGPNAPHPHDYRFMVGGFLNSDEYRYRFAAPTQ